MSPMPPKRACRWPGCPGVATRRGRCAAHDRAAEQRRGSAHARGYGKDWQALRARILATEPLCRHCESRGHVTAATEVHHAVRVRHDASRRLDATNLVPLCQACHSRLTLAEDVDPRREA